jgi:putative phage-type endonuclease
MKKYNDIEQRSEAWHQIKKGVISGTSLKNIMGTPKAREDEKYEIIAQRLTVGVETEYVNPMERGIELEDEAIAEFEFNTGLKVEKTGFCENDDNDKIGYSPDGLIGETEDIEVKCPMGKNYVKAWLKNEIPKEYYWQVIQAFVVNPKLEKRYFVLYNPSIPIHQLHIIEVVRDEAVIEKARLKQEEFLREVDEILNNLITI